MHMAGHAARESRSGGCRTPRRRAPGRVRRACALRRNCARPAQAACWRGAVPAGGAKLDELLELKAQDLWPLVAKLSHDEQVRLAKLALAAAGRVPAADGQQYKASPPGAEEFSTT